MTIVLIDKQWVNITTRYLGRFKNRYDKTQFLKMGYWVQVQTLVFYRPTELHQFRLAHKNKQVIGPGLRLNQMETSKKKRSNQLRFFNKYPNSRISKYPNT